MQMKRQNKLYLQKTTILLAVYLALRFLLPLCLPFVLAWATVSILTLLQKKTHIRLVPLAVIYLLLFLILFGSIALFGCWILYEPCRNLLPVCQNYWEQFSEYLAWIPEALTGKLAIAMPTVFSGFFRVFLYMISILLFAKDWEKFNRILLKLPFSGHLLHAGKKITQSLRGWVKAQGKIMLIVAIECAVGYYFLDISGFWFFAILTGFFDALPVFGTALIFLPWTLVLLLQGSFQKLLWLLPLWLITWLTREFLEPKLLGDGLGLLPVCFLMSVIIGLELFGPLGIFSGPFGVLLTRELWRELEKSAPPQKSSSSSSADGQT